MGTVGQRLEQVVQQRALAAANEGLHRHPRADLQAGQATYALLAYADAHPVVRRLAALVQQAVGRDQGHFALHPRRSALVEGAEHQLHRQADADLVDHLHRQPSVHQQRLALREDFHQLLAGRDHAALGEHFLADHQAGDRRPYLAVGQVEARAGQAIAQLLGAHLGVGQAGAHLFLELLPPLGHAQAQFEDLPAGTAEAAEVAGDLAVDLGQQALAVEQAVARHVALAGQLAQAAQLFLEGGALLLLAAQRGLQAVQLRLAAGDRLGETIEFQAQRPPTAVVQLPLLFQQGRQARVVQRQQLGGKLDPRLFIALGAQPRQTRQRRHVLGEQAIGLGPGLGSVHLQQHLSCLHPLAFVHADVPDQAAGRVLHGLAATGHHHRAGDPDALVQRGQPGPQEKADEAEQHQPPAEPGKTLLVQFQRRAAGADFAQPRLPAHRAAPPGTPPTGMPGPGR